MEVVRKWGLKFNGGKNVIEFVDRVEELAYMYQVPLDILPAIMPEILCEKALMWYVNNNSHWQSWHMFKKDFCNFFLPLNFFEKLEDEILRRIQKPQESFKDYLLALQELMRPTKMSEEEKLERIFRNLQSDYLWYVKQKDFTTLEELIGLAEDFEGIPPDNASNDRHEYHRMLKSTQLTENKDGKKLRGQRQKTNNRTSLQWHVDKITASIIIDETPCTAKVDTGATRSFIAPAQLLQLRTPPQFGDVNIQVTQADGTDIRITDAIDADVTLGNKTARCILLVRPGAMEFVVLGMDFLGRFNTTITCAGLHIEGAPSNAELCSFVPVIKNEVMSVSDSSTNTKALESTVGRPSTSTNTTASAGYTSVTSSTPTTRVSSASILVNSQSVQENLTNETASFTTCESSRDSLKTFGRNTTMPLKSLSRIIDLEQAPEKLRAECLILANSPGSFPRRFRRRVLGQRYRITITRTGTIKIVMLPTFSG